MFALSRLLFTRYIVQGSDVEVSLPEIIYAHCAWQEKSWRITIKENLIKTESSGRYEVHLHQHEYYDILSSASSS